MPCLSPPSWRYSWHKKELIDAQRGHQAPCAFRRIGRLEAPGSGARSASDQRLAALAERTSVAAPTRVKHRRAPYRSRAGGQARGSVIRKGGVASSGSGGSERLATASRRHLTNWLPGRKEDCFPPPLLLFQRHYRYTRSAPACLNFQRNRQPHIDADTIQSDAGSRSERPRS